MFSHLRHARRFRRAGILLALLLAAAAVWGLAGGRLNAEAGQLLRLRAWFANPGDHPTWQVKAGERCGQARSPQVMLMPTSGYIGFGWDDSFRPGHHHSGYDIFSPDRAVNVTPVVAAYDGYLTREAAWKSTVILRHPDFPAVVPGEQIWTYYTHMASADGEESFVAPAFPPGTREVFVRAGTLLGYQGNWSGSPLTPTGIHLHFSIVRSTAAGGYANETEIANTYDPGPFLGITRDSRGVFICGESASGS